jgi:hypothetical protein
MNTAMILTALPILLVSALVPLAILFLGCVLLCPRERRTP